MTLSSWFEILTNNAAPQVDTGSHRPRYLPLSRYRISLLVGCAVIVLALPVLLLQDVVAQNYTATWTSTTSLLRPQIAIQPPDLSQTLSLTRLLFPPDDNAPAAEDHSWIAENERTIAALFRCVEQENCSTNQTKVVILAAGPFTGLLYGENGGEAIWANSTLLALRRLGYSYLYSINAVHTRQLYNIFRELVPVILFDVPEDEKCFHNQECVRTKDRLHGIPAWKMFSFHFWDSAANPLGKKWTLSPENYSDSSGTNYLGYSVEPQCVRQSFIPHERRPQQAYVLAKEAGYFNHKDHAFAADFFEAAASASGTRFLAGVRESVLPEYFPRNITNVGFSSAARFYQTLANSRVLVGIGVPVTSPTPYEALCLGVPFINPILHWDAKNPTDRKRWASQHTPLKYLDPPYVYNVFKDDKAGFVKAVLDATSTPIESFVLEHMRMRAVEARLASLLETDWKSEAVKLLAERKASGSGETFWV